MATQLDAHLSDILKCLPDRTKARAHCDKLNANDHTLLTKLHMAVLHRLASSPPDHPMTKRFVICWQTISVALHQPAIIPPGFDGLEYLLPLAQFHLSYLLAGGGLPVMSSRLEEMLAEKVIHFGQL